MSIKYPTYASIAEHTAPPCNPLWIPMLLERKAVFCRNGLLSLNSPFPVQLRRGGLAWHQSLLSPRTWVLGGSKARLHSFTSTPVFCFCHRLYNWPAETSLPLMACTEPHEEGGDYRCFWRQNAPLLRQQCNFRENNTGFHSSQITLLHLEVFQNLFHYTVNLRKFYTCHLPAFFLFFLTICRFLFYLYFGSLTFLTPCILEIKWDLLYSCYLRSLSSGMT